MLGLAGKVPMVTATPEQIRDDAEGFFRRSEVPDALQWINLLSPVHLRLFAVQLADGLRDVTLRGDLQHLAELVEDWEATAHMDASPELWAEIRRPKEFKPLAHFVNS